MNVQAITVRLPVRVYERLRLEAFEKRTSQAAIIAEELRGRYGLSEEDPDAAVPQDVQG